MGGDGRGRRAQWRPRARLALICMAAISAGAVDAGKAQASSLVDVFPIPGSRLATPQTQISFRNIHPSAIGSITVTGSASGVHPGRIEDDSDGDGASFYPAHPFSPGERVTVTTTLRIRNGSHGVFHFVVQRPEPAIAPQVRWAAAREPGDLDSFHSRPGLMPARIHIDRPFRRVSDVFLTPMHGPVQWGPMIVDRWGHLVWFDRLSGQGAVASNLAVQRYRGQRVLTWWQGNVLSGFGEGVDQIYDRAYRPVATVRAGNGLWADLHEFQITPQGTALITAFNPVHWDDSEVHAGHDLSVLDCVIQEIDIRTGNVLFQWDSLDHVPISDSYVSGLWPALDYFHINSIQLQKDGNLIISARNTWAVYEISHTSGAVLWRLGGKRSTFRMGSGTRVAFQHDALMHPGGLLTMFDDGASPQVHPQSRVVFERVNTAKRKVTLVRQFDHSPSLVSEAEGSVQLLAGGNTFVGWGAQPYFTEYNSRGRQIFDGHFVDSVASYRAYESPWNAQPLTSPDVAAKRTRRRTTTVYVSWNGATDVEWWRVLAARSPRSLRPVIVRRKHGFETAISVAGRRQYFQVQALGSAHRPLARSRVIRVR